MPFVSCLGKGSWLETPTPVQWELGGQVLLASFGTFNVSAGEE